MSESATFRVEKSYEATTLDYLSPRWFEVGEPMATEGEAQTEADRLYRESSGPNGNPAMFRVKRIAPKAEVDAALAADFAANQQYWADRAAEAKRQQEALQRILDLKGQTVTVTKGRKVPVGTTGKVFWVGEGRYDGYRVGLKTVEGETHWTAASNVTPETEMEMAR